MQAHFARAAAFNIRRNGITALPAVAACRAVDVWWKQTSTPSLAVVTSPSRGLAVERMVNGIKITGDTKISEPVRRVLSLDNGTK